MSRSGTKPATPYLWKGSGLGVVIWGVSCLTGVADYSPSMTGQQDDFLLRLNYEYILALNQRRQTTTPGAARARLDTNLLYSAVLFNIKLDKEDTLYHDQSNLASELCGTLYNAPKREPKVWANYILKQLENSPPHRAIQLDTSLRFVAISASNLRYVVRLSGTPTPRRKVVSNRP